MSLVHEEKTFGRARRSFANEAEIDEFVATLEKYERGEITPDQWRAYRLVRGTYGQRQAEDGPMLRGKIPQGPVTTHHPHGSQRRRSKDARSPPGCPAPTAWGSMRGSGPTAAAASA